VLPTVRVLLELGLHSRLTNTLFKLPLKVLKLKVTTRETFG
jgi:hypothetical protein